MKGKGKAGKDLPEVYDKVRGNKTRGLEIAGDAHLLQAAMTKYTKDEKSSGDTSEFSVRTWKDFHNAVDWTTFGLDKNTAVFPLTPLKLNVVGSI